MSNSNTFHQLKREFLHRQLDEVIAIWARGSGQGKFQLKVAEGVPDFQFIDSNWTSRMPLYTNLITTLINILTTKNNGLDLPGNLVTGSDSELQNSKPSQL